VAREASTGRALQLLGHMSSHNIESTTAFLIIQSGLNYVEIQTKTIPGHNN
jgi:hypothetical protein